MEHKLAAAMTLTIALWHLLFPARPTVGRVSPNFEPCGSTLYQGYSVGGFDTMKKLITKVQKFMQAEDGPTAVEYAIMLALIVIVCIAAIQAVGNAANGAFENVTTEMTNSGITN